MIPAAANRQSCKPPTETYVPQADLGHPHENAPISGNTRQAMDLRTNLLLNMTPSCHTPSPHTNK
nr:MAG TPA: hypothetical protein [Caudoviricetes sp.]